jgi:VWFA-related protein
MKRTWVAFFLVLQLVSAGLAQTKTDPPAVRPESQIRRMEREQEQQRERERQRQQTRAQQNQSDPASEAQDDSDVVRITTNLVQVDAVVTDKKGQAVVGLTPEDFEILENGKSQPITNFSFIEVTPPPGATKPGEKPVKPAKNALPIPPARLKAGQVTRTIALVVDDLMMSFFSVGAVKETLKKFVREQMQPGDMVAIIRASAGIGALEQFTNNKQQLMAAVERVRWYPRESNRIAFFNPIESGARSLSRGPDPTDDSRPRLRVESAEVREMRELDKQTQTEIDQYREQVFTVGTLGALNYVVRGMKTMPGRKAVVLLSDGLNVMNARDLGTSSRALDRLQQLTDLANRSAVVFYTIDGRGLVNPAQFYAEDDTSDLMGDFAAMDAAQESRGRLFRNSRAGADLLATQTGGISIYNTNDLNKGLGRVLSDQKSYYLIGYRPDSDTFKSGRDGRPFNKISVRVKNPELRVRSRTGFIGISDEELRTVSRTRDERLISALISPFSAGNIDVRVTALFLNDEKAGSFMRSLLHLDARDLTFTTEKDGRRKVVIDIAALTFGNAGTMVDSFNRTHTIHVPEAGYQAILQQGLRYEVAVPVKKPGPYQMRIAVRDAATDRIGSVSQFIEVPDLTKGRLALSGLLLGKTTQDQAQAEAARHTTNTGSSSESDSAVRRFRVGAPLDYAFVIYNARLDKTTSLPRLTRQVRLFRDGKLVHSSDAQPLEIGRQADLKRMVIAEQLQISGITAGEYALQVVITDQLARGEHAIATQWIDFEVL